MYLTPCISISIYPKEAYTFMTKNIKDIETQERLQRAKNKFQLIRRQIQQNKNNKDRMLALVREYVSQRPEVAQQVIAKWISQSRR